MPAICFHGTIGARALVSGLMRFIASPTTSNWRTRPLSTSLRVTTSGRFSAALRYKFADVGACVEHMLQVRQIPLDHTDRACACTRFDSAHATASAKSQRLVSQGIVGFCLSSFTIISASNRGRDFRLGLLAASLGKCESWVALLGSISN